MAKAGSQAKGSGWRGKVSVGRRAQDLATKLSRNSAEEIVFGEILEYPDA